MTRPIDDATRVYIIEYIYELSRSFGPNYNIINPPIPSRTNQKTTCRRVRLVSNIVKNIVFYKNYYVPKQIQKKKEKITN